MSALIVAVVDETSRAIAAGLHAAPASSIGLLVIGLGMTGMCGVWLTYRQTR